MTPLRADDFVGLPRGAIPQKRNKLEWMTTKDWQDLLDYPYPALPKCCGAIETLRSILKAARWTGVDSYYAERIQVLYEYIVETHTDVILIYFPLLNQIYTSCKNMSETN